MTQYQTYAKNRRVRRSFGKINEVTSIPNLIEMQKKSFDEFVSINGKDNKNNKKTLEYTFASIFPISNYSETATLEFVALEFGEVNFDVDECLQRSLTYATPFRMKVRLVLHHIDPDTGAKTIKDVREQSIHINDLPLMTDNGTFIFNGNERVIVSQVHRSPGVFFDLEKEKVGGQQKSVYSARIIPYRGSWLDMEFDFKDLMYFRIDRKRKLYLSSLLYALGYSQEEILDAFYKTITLTYTKKGWTLPFNPEFYKGLKVNQTYHNAETGEVVFEAGEKITARKIRQLQENNLKTLLLSNEAVSEFRSKSDLIDPQTGQILVEAGYHFNPEALDKLINLKYTTLDALEINNVTTGGYLLETMLSDKNTTKEDALYDVYRILRPGEPPTIETATQLFESLFFDADRYNLSEVGRMKMNQRLGLKSKDDLIVLTKEDILEVAKTLHAIRDGEGTPDDIDHLGNRRVRPVGELLQNQFLAVLPRMEKAVREKINSISDFTKSVPYDFVNTKIVTSTIKEFFGSSQLSQFMDQINPLAEITHKRRLSALGPGGLSREHVGFEVRDVHTTHYGRICPIETPEGQNIGLINSLTTYARINKHGFIETPYRKVVNGKVTDQVEYLSASEEGKYIIAQADSEINAKGEFVNEMVVCRTFDDFVTEHRSKVDYIDVSPKQVVSVATSLIPFLENDDANRALMGSNMQRQAVPLIKNEAPFVGTGMEGVVARDSSAAVACKRSGVVDRVDSTRIVIRVDNQNLQNKDELDNDSIVDIYRLRKFQRTNQSTCINQKPIVKVGDRVEKGEIIADGTSTDLGELALGKNVLVAFMPWNGYNFEDSILISEEIVSDDIFTSIHIEEFEVMARDTKLGTEEITRDIPGVSEESLSKLDEAGIVYIGAEVRAGDILVGKVTPKGESVSTPEDKLLRAIFGEKAADVRDSSLRLPPGSFGTVVDVRVFNRHGIEKDQRTLQIERETIIRYEKDFIDERNILERNLIDYFRQVLVGKECSKTPKQFDGNKDSLTERDLAQYTTIDQISHFVPKDKALAEDLSLKLDQHHEAVKKLEKRLNEKVNKIQKGDDLLTSVLKVVKVFVAVKRKLQPGDKMAGRHGNKGVVSKVLPVEDMPYLSDGTPVQIVLNPLGVPSRMNVGQILETHLGWAAAGYGKQIKEIINKVQIEKETKLNELRKRILDSYGDDFAKKLQGMSDEQVIELANKISKGVHFATPVFDGANIQDINLALNKAGLDSSGQVTLYDGRTGVAFDKKVTVGYIYMLKLNHLVDDKIHARSIGSYSIVTQQPLGGKAQFGGQRFGEMEVWAMQAYGAAYTLQELLTIKSDDIAGRTKVYESIIQGKDSFETGIPESFNVLVKEIRSLGLDFNMINKADYDDSLVTDSLTQDSND